ncbi:MAG: hypothetical protein H6733_01595 [Alphaproteobacteria bacterium]|nr:hypothetical protein [Alphaproteobacteria bacterium]
MNVVIRRFLLLFSGLLVVAIVASYVDATVTSRAAGEVGWDGPVARAVEVADTFWVSWLFPGLVLLLVAQWWVRSVAHEQDPTEPPPRARKPVPNPGTLDPIRDLTGLSAPPADVPLPEYDPEAGGDHVYRWRPEDEA